MKNHGKNVIYSTIWQFYYFNMPHTTLYFPETLLHNVFNDQ